MGAGEIAEPRATWRVGGELVKMKPGLVRKEREARLEMLWGKAARGGGRPPTSRPYLIECPVCPDFIDHAWCESIAWEWASVHDEVEGHDAGTAYVVYGSPD